MNAKFTINENGTVFDNETKLTWQREVMDKDVNMEKAKLYARDLRLGNFTDWRVPTIRELLSIVDYTRYNPAIDTDTFPNTPSVWFWSVSPCAYDSGYAWIVSFSYGSSGNYGVSFSNRVRCVRG